MSELTNKLKILRNPSKKSARQLLKDINKKGYEVSIKNRGDTIVRIDKKQVPLSLNGKKIKCEGCGYKEGIKRQKGNYSTYYCDDCYLNMKSYGLKGI